MNYINKMNKTVESGLLNTVGRTLPDLLQSLGISVQPIQAKRLEPHSPDLWMRLTVDNQSVEIAVCVRSRVTDQVIARAGELAKRSITTLIVVPHIRPEIQRKLKARNINFADLTGTISLRAPGIRLDVRGNLRVPENARSVVKQSINPFSKKASSVLRVLCENFPNAMSLPALAEQTGLSRAWVFSVVRELITRAYASNGEEGVILNHPVTMLRDWITEYRWSRNSARHYIVPFEGTEFIQHLREAFNQRELRWALTLIAGAELRVDGLSQNNSYHVYAEANDASLTQALEAMYAQPVREGGNLILFSPPYYGSSVFIGAHDSKGVKVVADLQLLLDLARYPLRGAELAETLVKSKIARQLELSASETRTLIEQFS